MFSRLSILLFTLLCMGCNSSAQNFVVYQSGSVTPVIIAKNSEAKPAADAFAAVFKKATGTQPLVEANVKDNPVIEVSVSHNPKIPVYFSIVNKDNVVHISGSDASQLYAAIQYFFAEYAGAYVGNDTTTVIKNVTVINIPLNLDYTTSPAFEYREPYFPENFNSTFRQYNNTQTIDDTWGLWGHNIGKKVKVTPKMLAQVNGKINEEQFCFSSPELQEALEAFITRQLQDNPAQSKFMVMPNDNALVCQCGSCKAKGNTKTNASPAVFTLLNALAVKFPKQQFFSTAYMSTQIPPEFKLAPNTGVMISTMAFPKGVVIENSNKKAKIEQSFSGWNKVTDKIYLWDYAVNFDNYFDFYPTVSIARQNLKFYKAQGVTGVFMHGSEELPSAFSGLKSYLYAQLLQNPDIDLRKHTKLYFDNTLASVSGLLSDYYLGIEKAAFESKKALDIYGGIIQSQKKYLDGDALGKVYKELSDKYPTLNKDEQKQLAPLLTAMAFQQLEISRSNGFEYNGYANYNEANHSTTLKREIPELLARLKEYADIAGITVYNESKFNVAGYLTSWQTEITGSPYKSLFYAKPFKSLSKPDEDFPNVKMLNDGNIGFNDYYNNWLVQTKNTIALQVNAADVKGATVVEMSFLNDTRHNIYLPERVVVTVGGKKHEASFTMPEGKGPTKHRVSIPVVINQADAEIKIEAVKQQEYKGKSVACDEIFFK